MPYAELGGENTGFMPFSSFPILWTPRSYFLEAVQTEKGMQWHLLDVGVFVFHLFLQCVSAFMSSLRQNIKEAHSLLIFTMTIQSFQCTDFPVCACTFHVEKSGCCHYFLNNPWQLVYMKFCIALAFPFNQMGQIGRIALHED